jgi:hypothetical protein
MDFCSAKLSYVAVVHEVMLELIYSFEKWEFVWLSADVGLAGDVHFGSFLRHSTLPAVFASRYKKIQLLVCRIIIHCRCEMCKIDQHYTMTALFQTKQLSHVKIASEHFSKPQILY